MDHIRHTKSLSLSKVRWLVFDEADRILELGYERDARAVVEAVEKQAAEAVAAGGERRRRQTMLLSATLTSGIEQLSEMSMRRPMFIDVAAAEEEEEAASEAEKKKEEGRQEQGHRRLTTPETLKQTFCIVPAKLRLVTLAAFVVWKCRLAKRARQANRSVGRFSGGSRLNEWP